MKFNKFKIIHVFVSMALLIFIVNKIGLNTILTTFKSIKIAYLPIIGSLYILTLILSGINLWILLRPVAKSIPLFRVITYSMVSWAVGLFTPGKLGEFSVVYLLNKDGLETGKGIAVALVGKFVTLSTLIICSGIGMFILFGTKYTIHFSVALASLFIGVYLLIFCIGKSNARKPITWLINCQSSLQDYFKNNKWLLVANFILTIVKWCITGLAFCVVFISFGSSANLVLIIIISMTITIINIIPITLHGLGLKEIAAVYLYGMIGVPGEVSVVSTLFFSMLAYSVGLIIFLSLGSHFRRK